MTAKELQARAADPFASGKGGAAAWLVSLSPAGTALAFGAALLCSVAGPLGGGAFAQQVAQPLPANGGQAVAHAAPPRCDANCVRSNAAKAAEACAPRIEAQAPSDFDWLTRPNPGIFQQADPSSPTDEIVHYRGDSIRFMTADKSWLRVSYECGYDVGSQTVAYVHVRAGRLGQPLPAVGQQEPPAPRPAVAAQMRPAPAPVPAGARPVPVLHRPRPRVGEPSPIEIEQESANPGRH